LNTSTGLVIIYKNKYLIQRRDNFKSIYFPNIHGLFGGMCKTGENPKTSIIREIKEELNISPNEVEKFLTFHIKSKQLTHRKRIYYYYNLPTNLKYKIELKEGKSLHFYGISSIKKIKFVPWDLAALLYYHYNILKNYQVNPIK
jgi:ADP-ribose pyrophosphatase YjhB (NUDIX family)